ncbi:MAG: molybdopterin-dependent oxidoreductase, partial [Candidatus Eremiobacteraeota bacterium]|nr:molybdopterin-dependent oxidoreductase [Candidatus Eremiobacteraeota bacterium]
VAAGRDAARTADALAARGVAVSCFVAGEQNNARGAEALGMLPRSGGFDTAATFAAARDGKLRVLSLFGVNPVLHHPLGGAAVRAALANVPFVVATELFLTETAELAHLVLPARASFEKSGHVYDLTGAPHGVFAGHAAPDGTLADGDMLVALAAELGLDVPAPDELLAAANAPAVAIAAGFADAILTGTPDVDASSRPAGGGLRLAIASHIFSGGGTAAFDDRLGGLRPIATATFAPATAAEAGVTPGDTIDLFAGERTLRDLTVAVDADLGADTVVVIDGLPSAPANALATGDAVAIGNVRSAYGALAAGAV